MPSAMMWRDGLDRRRHPLQAGRTIVVTGATSGLGYHTARELARAGAEVVLAVRDAVRGRTVLEQTGAAAFVRLDLADLASVTTAAHEVRERWPRVDALVNNAGVMGVAVLSQRNPTPDLPAEAVRALGARRSMHAGDRGGAGAPSYAP